MPSFIDHITLQIFHKMAIEGTSYEIKYRNTEKIHKKALCNRLRESVGWLIGC